MVKLADPLVRCCDLTHGVPAAVFCILLFMLQAAVMDYYLIYHLNSFHLLWTAADLLNLVLLIACVYLSNVSLERQKVDEHATYFSIAWVSWLLINGVLSAKTIVIFVATGDEIEEEEPTFFGPNTMKTTIALSSCIFLLLLTTQHDAPLGSDRRRYIEELTGTVVFDLLDTVDILEILFDKETVYIMWQGLEEGVFVVAAFNLIIPALPLFTLSWTKFGRDKLRKKMVYIHRLLVVLMVNVPNLLVRMILWHGFSVGITAFSLKNVILISLTLYEFYEHKKEKFHLHKRKDLHMAELGGKGHANKGFGDGKTQRHKGNEAGNIWGVAEENKSVDETDESFAIESRVIDFI
ncbi:uncharacterized protein LOC101846570 [Aplysia californica]|uniref:Uncharacterized protein LOC101846570 n=1 Tax=Aplysia californica TaxID=6500 RepID=A0ABM1VR16_APLCA|nr:uncharacterized protein LOC101846570 [Aplysia californica]XP_035824858.1 uncharacterized protein LOC101846570 [Aplysia californica]